MRSPSIGQASRVTKNGVIWLIEPAWASGRCLTPKKNIAVDISSRQEREICTAGRTVRSTESP
ncbi:MAG: hypothetical protein IRZ13_01820 [Acetobacteraceae bacterium]|nr:hypothetical protein [Acetobacteraceae bacterium]